MEDIYTFFLLKIKVFVICFFQEYPYHLIKLNDTNRFEKFLTEWEVFDRLFDKEHSGTLLKYWSKVGFTHQFGIPLSIITMH